MNRSTRTSIAVASLALVAPVFGVAAPAEAATDACNSGRFCAYRLGSYTDKILDSGATSGTVDVINGATTGGKNRMSTRKWCGRNQQSFRDDDVVFAWAPLTNADLEGSGSDNKIDIFDVVGPSTGCPN